MKRLFLFAILITVALCVYAQDPLSSARAILIRNVTISDQSEHGHDVIVNLLIKQKKMNLVSTDKITLSRAWNYIISLYRPRTEILEGGWTFPEPKAVK
jgi:hypothetical protein